VAEVFAQNPAALDDYRAGKKRAEGFLIGQAMKALGGRADPVAVKQAVSAALASIE
jgi:aspartyl-tRNA(Asn)/glutamyl-tRNA(Gln) amidotransferase subunit B